MLSTKLCIGSTPRSTGQLGTAVINARELTARLGGRWVGTSGRALCPCCGGNKSNLPLSIIQASDGGVRLHCFKGCAFQQVRSAAGLEDDAGQAIQPASREDIARREAQQAAQLDAVSLKARSIWDDTAPGGGTLVETYLRSRAITLPVPPTLHFTASCWHSDARRSMPAMVALVEGGERFGIHRTYLQDDGGGKASVLPDKMNLGSATGGYVLLTPPADVLLVGEGIESTLSALQLMQADAADRLAAAAALSTSGMDNMVAPSWAKKLIVAMDNDEQGQGQRAASRLVSRVEAAGIEAAWISPVRKDFNDDLKAEVVDAH